MQPENNEKRNVQADINDEITVQADPVSVNADNDNILSGEAPYYEVSLCEGSPAVDEPPHNENLYNNTAYTLPVYDEPPSYSGQPYNTQSYSAPPVYYPHSHVEHAYRAPHDNPWNMYSPGICVDQPYPRARVNENGRNGTQREKGNLLVGFLRAMALVLVCAFFSGAAAYAVMDYRFNRGDFAQTNHVILGGGIPDRSPDGNFGAPIVSTSDGMTAQDIYDMARTQVVGINTEMQGFFGLPDSSGTVTPVSGSGFIVSSDGYILTNYHVIEFAHEDDLPINVVLNDGTTYSAKVIGFDKSNDVAVIKIDATGLNPANIGNSNNIRVGQTIYAVGNPFGDLVYTMTDGIISALDRVVSVEGKSISTFQFSAAVNHGNSGGPIYNTDGEVVGIVTAKVVRGNVEGIGFAIPINDAIEITTELIEHGYISGRPLIGVTVQTVSPAHAEYYDWVVGVYVRSVEPDSAAEAAGIAVGDIITGIGSEDIDSMIDLRFALRSYRAGDTTTLSVWREGETLVLTITFDEDMHAGQPQIIPVPELDSPDPFKNLP